MSNSRSDEKKIKESMAIAGESILRKEIKKSGIYNFEKDSKTRVLTIQIDSKKLVVFFKKLSRNHLLSEEEAKKICSKIILDLIAIEARLS